MPAQHGFLRNYGVQFRRVTNIDDASEFMRWLGQSRRLLGVDTETSGLSIERDHIRYIQFGDLKTGWAIPWEDWRGLAVQALKVYEGEFVFHNSKFDVRHIENDTGIKWPWHRTHDTMTMAHLLNPLRPKGLKPLAAMLVDPQAVAAQRQLDEGMAKEKWTWETVPLDFPPYWIYAAMDPVLTCHIAEHLLPDVMEKYREPYDLEMGTTRVISKVEAQGAEIDLDYCVTKQHEFNEYALAARAWIRDEFKLNPTGPQLLKYFEANNIPMLGKKTKSGSQSMDKEVMESIDHPLATTVLNIRKAEKMAGSYFKNFVNMVDENNRLHCNIWTMGTRTARMSVTDPALQTLPRKDPTVRNAFIPSDGNVLISCDYDQVEARLMAHFSQSPGLVQAFLGDDDFFCTLASEIFNEPISKDDPRRHLTKGVVYGKQYGAGIDTMAATAKVDRDQMAGVVSKFDRSYPEVVKFQRQVHMNSRKQLMAGEEASITTPTGRRLVSDDGKDYTLTNYLIQSHASEILKRKLVDLDTVLDDDCKIILPIHDELVFDVPKDTQEDVAHVIQKTMSDYETYSIPITASYDIMEHRWGDKYS